MRSAELVVIGCSAGGFEALTRVLPALSARPPFAVAVVIHIAPDYDPALAGIFQARCHCRVKEAEDKERFEPGTIYFAPAGYHLLVERDRSFSLSLDEPVNYSRPSIDVLFTTAALACREQVAGVILTGGNDDGARGLAEILRNGGQAIAQDPATALHSTMPSAAIAWNPGMRVLELDQIAGWLEGNE